MVPLVFALLIAAFLPSIQCQSTPRRGTVRLVRDASVIQGQSVTSGRVQIFLSRWGHICDDDDFSITEAIVICHQLGFSSASSYSRTSRDSFGFDGSVPYALDEVDCTISSYLVILQCRHRTSVSSGCRVNGDEVSVTCLSTRIWSSPYDGQIRLQDATYTNQGLVEVYCNGQWGTICDDGFGSNDANTVCRQQGYTGAATLDSLSLTGNIDQPIWFTFVPCSFAYSCLRNCQRCPSARVTSCIHSEDITVECEFSSGSSVFTTLRTCDFGTTTISSTVTGIVVAIVILVLICTLLPILIPVCICCCLGVGICGAIRNRGSSTRVVTTSAPPPATAVAQTTTAYPTQQPNSYQPPPTYAAQPPAAYPPQEAYPPPDGGYPPQPYLPTQPSAEYGGAVYPPTAPHP